MGSEKTVAFVALVWLIVSFLFMTRSIRRGRELAEDLANRHPEIYESLGRPRPGYFESARRTRFSRYVGKREFADLADGALAAQFEAYRKSEARLIITIIASGALISLLTLAARHAT